MLIVECGYYIRNVRSKNGKEFTQHKGAFVLFKLVESSQCSLVQLSTMRVKF